MSRVLFFGFFLFNPSWVIANPSALPGETLGLLWALPFSAMLLSLALCPLFTPHVWESHYGKIACGIAAITIISLFLTFGGETSCSVVLATLFHDYLPFIIMIGALYTIAGGIQIRVEAPATPFINTGFLALGTILAGWIGTTGASMVCIRPFLHLNGHRVKKVHHVIFFIFLVANIGGALTPLGDPPLFLGFLKGVDFFWPLTHLSASWGMMSFFLLGAFYFLDAFMAKQEGFSAPSTWPKVTFKGALNGCLFLGVLGFVLLSGLWTSSGTLELGFLSLEVSHLVREGGLIFLATLSYLLTSPTIHKANHFSWGPLQEVAKLFFGIFITVIPVVAILQAGPHGALAPLIHLVTHQGIPQNEMYFWLSGGLSSCLDNAPTYLVFFHMAGGDSALLMTKLSQTLVAISLGSVFMGAMTYIGNAPNFMVKTISESHKIRMPSFFGYMLWSCSLLLPLFCLLAWWRF